MRSKICLVAIAAALVLPVFAVAGPAGAAGGPAVCVASGTTLVHPGLSLTSAASHATFSGSVTCVGGGGSGAIEGSGTLVGTCATSTATFSVGGALSGSVHVTTIGGLVLLTGTLNGSSAVAVGLFIPTGGNCLTAPVTKATFVLAGPLA
jgi:hypothetical protein